MKNIIKKTTIALLVTALMLTYLVFSSSALDFAKDYFVIEGNTYYDISQDLSGNGWSWDASEFKLTLNGYNSSYILFCPAKSTSKTLKIVLKNTNTVKYNKDEVACPIDNSNNCDNAGSKCNFCYTDGDIAALYVLNCAVNLSGGTLNATATGSYTDAIYFSYDSTIENTTLNCKAPDVSLGGDKLTIKKSTVVMDSQVGYSANLSCVDCKLTYKNSNNNGEHREVISSGGDHVFKNCTFDIITGARQLDNETLYFRGFQGRASYEFDNTVLKVKQGTHNNPNNSYVLFSLGYPELEKNHIIIKNNSEFEIDKCMESVFSAQQVEISNSKVTGACLRRFVGAAKFSITNSDIDITGNGDATGVFIEAHEINIKNSKVKLQTKGYLWVPNQDFDFSNEKKLSLVDSQIDFSGKVDKFGEKWSLKYSEPEKWIVMLDGAKSNSSVNSSKLDIRHEKLVIKIDENYKPNQAEIPSTSSTQNSSQSNESSTQTGTSSMIVDNSSVDSGNQTGSQQGSAGTTGVEKPEEQPNTWWIWVVVAVVLVGGSFAAFFVIKNKKK